jgi:hypothetical protein
MMLMKYQEETYNVSISRDRVTGIAVGEAWSINAGPRNVGGIMEDRWVQHRIDGPAEILRDPVTAVVIEEAWYKDGRLHRADGPAIIRRDALTGDVKYTSWYRDGVLIPRNQRPKKQSSPHAVLSRKAGPSG